MQLALSVNSQDTLLFQTLEECYVIDIRVDHDRVFKNEKIELNTKRIGIESGLDNALKKTIPVYFKNYSFGGISSIDFRGTGAERTKVYWNGIPINSPTLGSFDFSLLPSFLLSEAKVRFGGASIVDGGGGIGGSIQLNQNTNFSENRIDIIGGLGSFGNYTSAIKAQFSNKKLKSDTRVFYQQGENNFAFKNTSKKDHPTEERTNNQLWRTAIQQAFSYAFNYQTSLELNFLYSKSDRNIPATISSINVGAWQGDELIFGQIGFNKVLNNRIYLKARSSIQKQVNEYKNGDLDAQNNIIGWNNKVDGKFSFMNLIVNTSLRYDLYSIDTYGTGSLNESQYSLFAAADWDLSRILIVSFGLRFEGWSNQLSPAMPYLAAAFVLPKNWGQLKSSITRVFRYPTLNERFWQPGGNPNLVPEEGWNYELTYSIERKNETFSSLFKLTGFYGLVNDWILWYPQEDFSDQWQAQNLWKVNSRGIEFMGNFQYKLSSDWIFDARLMYTFNNSIVIDDGKEEQSLNGKKLILVPEHMVFIPLSVTYKKLTTGIDYSYTGERFIDRQNNNALKPFHLLDLLVAYTFLEENLDLSFRLNNILDQSYQTYPGQPLPGINFNIQLQWRIL